MAGLDLRLGLGFGSRGPARRPKSPEKTQDVEHFLQSYRKALNALEAGKILDHYSLPFQASSPGGSAAFVDVAAAEEYINGLISSYRNLGVERVEILDGKVDELPHPFEQVQIRWGLYGQGSELVGETSTTYILRFADGQWKIIFMIAHNET